MPSINIKEVDISPVATADVTTNAVYVPGYARTGPVGEPILFETLEAFQEVFGSSPYLFESDGDQGQSANWVYSWKKDTPEPSYVYASDLLRLGNPVLFERLDGSNVTASVTLTNTGKSPVNIGEVVARYPGKFYTKVYVELESRTETVGGTGYTGYILTVGRDADESMGISEISPVETFFTFSDVLNQAIPKYELYTISQSNPGTYYDDNSGLVKSKWLNSSLPNISSKTYLTTGSQGPEFTPAAIYSFISNDGLEKIKDRNEYVLKYITAGGYPTLFAPGANYTGNEYAEKLLGVATSRKDVTALIDYNVELDSVTNNPYIVQGYANTWIHNHAEVASEDVGNYGAIFTPWCTIKSPTINNKEITMSPSFAYLSAMAQSTQNFANWYAVAGVTRGVIPNLTGVTKQISDSVGNDLQPTNSVAINPIQQIRPYGYRIWGSRTLRDNFDNGDLTATSFLNIRQLANDVKRVVYVASKECMFEPDDDVLWINYKSKITPLLDRMKGNRGLTDYSIRRVATDAKATLKAVIRLYCIDPVEHFDITLELTDGQVTTAE